MVGMTDEIIQRDPFPDTSKVLTAVVTGEHPFNVPGFHNLFRGLPEIDAYPQHMDQFVADWGHVRARYDVVLFYNFHLDTPPANERGWWQSGTEAALQELAETGQGIVVLHHAINAFPGWAFWSEMVGIPHADRVVELQAADPSMLSFGETLHLKIADLGYPITNELGAFDLHGETWGPLRLVPEPTCHILLTIDHPKMVMKAMAWTHKFRNARVFCLLPGHNNDSYADPIFRTLLSRGIHWAAGRL